jgi:hypothetical protein
MTHLLTVAALVLAAWTVLALPLGILVGRRLRRVRPATSPTRPTAGSTR